MNYNKFTAAAVSLTLALSLVSPSAFAAAVEFSDVPADHWAHSYIMSMADKGIMSGVGNNQFAPSSPLTYAEFLTMITKQFYRDKLTESGEHWYSPYMDAAEAVGILFGVNPEPLAKINRYEMAQIMYNVLREMGIHTSTTTNLDFIGDFDTIPSKYQDAVAACHYCELMSGTDSNGTFSGLVTVDRAQAAVVMDKLNEICIPYVNGRKPSPEFPPIPAGATQITKYEQLEGQDGMEEVPGGFHCTGAGTTYGPGSLLFNFRGATSLSFTVRAVDEDVYVSSGKGLIDAAYMAPLVMWEDVVVKKGTSKTFTYDVSDAKVVGITLRVVNKPGSNGACPSDCYITDIYLY